MPAEAPFGTDLDKMMQDMFKMAMDPNAMGPGGMPDPAALAKMLSSLEPGGMAGPEDQAQF